MQFHERYRVLERIGDGGAGVVYKVEDAASGEIRALKVLPRTTGRANLRSEFVALARLRHENIVSVFDYGLTESGDDFFTMEYVKGPALAECGAQPGSPPFYQMIAGILRGLAFVHARGMVHADIKPSNVLLDGSLLNAEPARAARLADFGLAAALEDPTASAARGTFPYAAPEVYAGQLDARSDLYAVGVLLYELVTSAPPYEGDNVASVLALQRRGAPPDPRERDAEIPAGLAELILGLLDPAPGARPQTADEVLARINDFAGTDFAVSEARPLVDVGAVLVGRDRDLADLTALWEQASLGRGAAVLVAGEEGIGKTRLLSELKLQVQLAGGRALRSSGTLPESLETAFAASGLDPDARYARADAVTAAALAQARERPLLLIVDDADTADAGTVEVLRYLARAVPEAPLLLCLASRDSGSLAGVVRGAMRGERIDLPPLDRSSVRRLVERALSAEIAEALAADLHRASGGNPAHAARALAALVERGDIARERGAWVMRERRPEIPLPADAVAAARARLSTLSPDATAVVETAAVLGERFDRWLLAAVLEALGAGVEDLDRSLAEAASARLLVGATTAGRFRFAHRRVARELAGDLPQDRRRAIHESAAALLEVRLAEGAVIEAGELARHFGALGDEERGVLWARKAAEARLAAFDHHGARAWLTRARPLLSTGSPEAAQTNERLGDLQLLLGDIEESRQSYEAAAAARKGGTADALRIARKLADLERRVGKSDRAIDLLMASLEAARRGGLVEEEVAAHLTIARVLFYRAEYRRGLEHATAGHLMALSRGDDRQAANLSRVKGTLEISIGDARSALESLEQALDDAGSTGDAGLSADVQLEIGRAGIHVGDYARAEPALKRAIAVYERTGRVEQLAKSLNNLGVAYYLQGKWSDARAAWERFRQLCERLDERTELTTALNNLGTLLRDLGELSEALRLLERGASVAEESGHAHMAAMVVGNRGEVLFRQGDLRAAKECYQRALAEFERIDARDDIVESKRRLAELALASGRRADALDQIIDSLRDAKDAGARLEEGILHRLAATGQRLGGDLESAAWFCQRGRQILEGLGSKYELARLAVEEGLCAAARSEHAEAAQSIQGAIEIFTELGARWDLSRARSSLRGIQPASGPRAAPRAGDGRGLPFLLELAQATASLQLDEILGRALESALGLTSMDRGFILLLDDEGRPTERMRRVRSGSRAFARDEAEFSGSIVRKVAASREAVAITDIEGEEDLRERKSVIALGLCQVLCAPMLARDQVIGIVYMDSRRLSVDDHEASLPLVEAFAAQMALAVENHRLQAEERRKTELMAILAHEIRNPLSGILGYSDIGERGATGDEPAELFARIRHDGERLRRLVDNVLELSRHEAGELDWSLNTFDMADLVADAVASFRPTCEKKGVELETDTEALLSAAFGNPDRLTQVVVNLIGNAVKFTPTGGRITVTARSESVSAEDPEAPPAPITTAEAWAPLEPESGASREFIRVDVSDTGPGMSEEIRERLFRKFSQGGKKRGKGVGLGLYISREIIRRHGGTIWVESEIGKGARFSFRIPVAG